MNIYMKIKHVRAAPVSQSSRIRIRVQAGIPAQLKNWVPSIPAVVNVKSVEHRDRHSIVGGAARQYIKWNAHKRHLHAIVLLDDEWGSELFMHLVVDRSRGQVQNKRKNIQKIDSEYFIICDTVKKKRPSLLEKVQLK